MYDIILYYIMLLYIITCDAAEPSSNTQESNSFNVRICSLRSSAERLTGSTWSLALWPTPINIMWWWCQCVDGDVNVMIPCDGGNDDMFLCNRGRCRCSQSHDGARKTANGSHDWVPKTDRHQRSRRHVTDRSRRQVSLSSLSSITTSPTCTTPCAWPNRTAGRPRCSSLS